MKVSELLTRARALIADPDRFVGYPCSRKNAKNAAGERRYHATQAIWHVPGAGSRETYLAVSELVAANFDHPTGLAWETVDTFTHEEVMAAYDRAIAQALKDENEEASTRQPAV